VRNGIELIIEHLQMAAMATHGLYEYYCEEGGVEGPSVELTTKVNACREARESIEKAAVALKKAVAP
jgi:hypothetical protein